MTYPNQVDNFVENPLCLTLAHLWSSLVQIVAEHYKENPVFKVYLPMFIVSLAIEVTYMTRSLMTPLNLTLTRYMTDY